MFDMRKGSSTMMHVRTNERTAAGTRRALPGLILLALLVPGTALAHPGHGGGFLPGLLHPFHGLDHLLAAIAVGAWGARLGGRAAWALPVAFVTAMLGGTLAAHATGVLPATEALIAASVLVLGVLLAANARLGAVAGMALVAVFAVFHGAAHGAEAPASGSFALHALGIGLATLALHASGLAAATLARSRGWIVRAAGAPVALAGAWMLATRMA